VATHIIMEIPKPPIAYPPTSVRVEWKTVFHDLFDQNALTGTNFLADIVDLTDDNEDVINQEYKAPIRYRYSCGRIGVSKWIVSNDIRVLRRMLLVPYLVSLVKQMESEKSVSLKYINDIKLFLFLEQYFKMPVEANYPDIMGKKSVELVKAHFRASIILKKCNMLIVDIDFHKELLENISYELYTSRTKEQTRYYVRIFYKELMKCILRYERLPFGGANRYNPKKSQKQLSIEMEDIYQNTSVSSNDPVYIEYKFHTSAYRNSLSTTSREYKPISDSLSELYNPREITFDPSKKKYDPVEAIRSIAPSIPTDNVTKTLQ
jgi:hypothetical protein